MILSTATEALMIRLGDDKAINLIAKAGFDAIDYSFFSIKEIKNHPATGPDYVKHAKHLVDIASANGVYFNQAHAVFPSGKVDNESFNKLTFDTLVRNIEMAGIMGVKNIVVHPIQCFGHNVDEWQYNMDFYTSLMPYAKEFNVKIAVENMWRFDPNRGFIVASTFGYAKELSAFIDAINPEHFTACLDVGHSALVGEMPDDAIRILGNKRIGCIHIQDLDYLHDLHTLPFTQKLDWVAITKALADIDYKGAFNFESDNLYQNYPDEMLPIVTKFMYDTGVQLVKMIEDAKTK